MWKPNSGENHKNLFLFFIKDYDQFANTNWMGAPTSWFSSSCSQTGATTSLSLPSPTGWKLQLPIYRHLPEGSFDSLPCTTFPPWNINQFMLYFCLQCLFSSSLCCLSFLPRSLHYHCRLFFSLSLYFQLSHFYFVTLPKDKTQIHFECQIPNS